MRDKKTYFLDLPTLLTYLSSQSCELTTELGLSGTTAQGSLILRDGKIVSCLLIFSNGQHLIGEQAYQYLQKGTEWQVHLKTEEEKKPVAPPAQFPSQFFPPTPTPFSSPYNYGSWSATPPRPKGPLDPAYLQNLSMKERLILRSVYVLINGRNSIEEIKNQLRLSPATIEQALATLRMLDVIE